MDRLPKITVVTPSYNQGIFLERTILSIITQDYPNLEYVVMDGGSKDNSVEIIKKYSNYITYWKSAPDGGQADAIATGFDMAKGEILCWINSDDMLVPDSLNHVANCFLRNHKKQWLVGSTVVIDENDNILNYMKAFPIWTPRIVFSSGQGTFQQGCFWRKELYKKVGGINRERQFCIDYELFAKFVCVSKPIWTNKLLGAFRMHAETKTSKMDDVRLRENQLIRELYKKSVSTMEARCYWLSKILWNKVTMKIVSTPQKLSIPELKNI